MSNPTDADWKRMLHVVEDFAKKQECEPFREPVPWKLYGLIDYPTLIKHPMDFGTIKKKLKAKDAAYTTLYKCNEDARLIWSNCMTYNADGSDFYKLAESLQKKWDIQFNKLLTDIGISTSFAPASSATTTTGPGVAASALSNTNNNNNDSLHKVSLQEKRNFAKLLYQITKEDLGKLLVDVEHKCPAALKRNAAEDEIELNVDAIPPSVMQELNAFLVTLKSSDKKKPPPGTKLKKQKTSVAAVTSTLTS